MVSLSGTVSAAFQCHWLMSSGSLEPPCVKILGGSSDAMQVRVFEPPADPTEPPPGAEQSPFSVFQSAVVLVASSSTSPSISNTDVGATAHAAVAVARIAAAPKGIKIRLELKYRTNPRIVRIAFPPSRGTCRILVTATQSAVGMNSCDRFSAFPRSPLLGSDCSLL